MSLFNNLFGRKAEIQEFKTDVEPVEGEAGVFIVRRKHDDGSLGAPTRIFTSPKQFAYHH